jgi:LacI family repressor for deo operon, udp, cdd, tsx, nupC, and nupG
MSALLSLPQPPTAVVAFSDEVAFGALRTLRRAGVPVPYAMSVVGIDDHHLADMFDLSTVHQPVTRQGFAAGELARRILQDAEVDSLHLTLPTHVVVRGTTAAPPESPPGRQP